MTQFNVTMSGVYERIERDAKVHSQLAWLIAKLVVVPLGSDVRPYDEIFGRAQTTAPTTPSMMRAKLIALADAWGADLPPDVLEHLQREEN
ncbi:hypothetical protein [Ketogulonicigenium vulgare]|uniref:hypothetical protein n=1 Tax=Ketogulonicigenium vulgare TaxID=92945 RepID=UPI002359CBF6|nr:hypothetical protein [Ketogulonicigenium vulgare]